MNTIQISIIIPVFNDSKGLKITIESIKYHLGNRNDIEIIVCNDGGGNDISQIAASYNTTEVRLKENNGAYVARNRGIDASKGEILAFLDANQWISDQWLACGLSAIKNNDYVGGKIIIETGEKPSWWELFDKATAFPDDRLQTSHFAPTANLFIHKYVFKNVGVFNEILRSGGDFEFGARVYKAGYKQFFEPGAVTFHPARNKQDQIKKQKRIACGYADVLCLIEKKSPLAVFLVAMLKFINVPLVGSCQIIHYIFLRLWKDNSTNLRFIGIKKLCKMIYYWHVMLRTFKHITGHRNETPI